MNICAGIILYNPDIERLTQNINAVAEQIDLLIFVDNASKNIKELQTTFVDERYIWIKNKTNLGISGALNQLMNFADYSGFDWILTLDQDSVCGGGIVQILQGAIPHFENTAVVSPRIIDREIPDLFGKAGDTLPGIEEINMCITSGCLTNIRAVLDAGGFDERLFIDQVDHDMCLRLRRRGHRIVRANTAELIQEFGQKTVRRRFLWRMVRYHNYQPLRVYYQTRNQLYMVRKYGTEFNPHPFVYCLYIIAAFIVKLIYEQSRIDRTKAFLKGFAAGMLMKTR